MSSETVDGRTSRFRCDPEGRVLERITPSGARSVWAYDPNGAPLSLATDAGGLTMAYDTVGHETSRIIAAGAAISRSWDGDHRLVSQALWRYQPSADGAPGAEGGYLPLAQRAFT